MCAQYGDCSYKWTQNVKWFSKNGRTSVTVQSTADVQLYITTTMRKNERTLELIRENRRITAEEVPGKHDVQAVSG